MLAGGIVREWASADLSKAAAWLAEAPAGVRNRISGPMVEIWAKTDTSAALDWVQDHLNGSSLDEAVGAVLKGAARKDVAAAADLVTGMEPSLARAKAAVSVARQWFPEFGTDKPVPPEAVAWISSLDEQSMKHVLDQVQWQWSGSDSQGFARFLASPAGKNAPEYALSSAARALARQDPVEALAWANSLPEERRGEAAGTVFTEWQSAQPAAATEWLNKLPAGDPRREAFYTSTLRQYMPTGEDVSHIARAMLSDRPARAGSRAKARHSGRVQTDFEEKAGAVDSRLPNIISLLVAKPCSSVPSVILMLDVSVSARPFIYERRPLYAACLSPVRWCRARDLGGTRATRDLRTVRRGFHDGGHSCPLLRSGGGHSSSARDLEHRTFRPGLPRGRPALHGGGGGSLVDLHPGAPGGDAAACSRSGVFLKAHRLHSPLCARRCRHVSPGPAEPVVSTKELSLPAPARPHDRRLSSAHGAWPVSLFLV